MIWAYAISFFSFFLIDQLSKSFFDGVVNSGISFGVLAEFGASFPTIFVLILSLFALFLIIFTWYEITLALQEAYPAARLRFALLHALWSGAVLSNLWDRVWFGGVRDIWTLPFLGLTNNAADWMIATVTLVWMWYLYRYERTKSK